jgi:hypothetical protein
MSEATIQIPFSIGQQIWWVGNGYTEVLETCPECAGQKALTLIQGNGEQVSLACACCSCGYEPPSGVIKKIVYRHKPEKFTPHRVSTNGNEITYSQADPSATAYSYVHVKDLFASEAECLVRCVELNEKRTKEQEECAIANLASKRRNMAWSVHYWGRLVRDLEDKLVRAKACLAVSKDKASQKIRCQMKTWFASDHH